MKIAAVVSGRADDAPMGPVIRELEARGAEVRKLDLSGKLLDDSPRSCIRRLTDGMELLAREFERDRPDIVLLLGDRYETLGAAQVAAMFRIEIAHIHGGETSEGSFDNEFRHAITQLATVHFVSAEAHRVRVLNLGADANQTYVVGAPGLDNVVDLPPQEFASPYFLVTYHPATKGKSDGAAAILAALKSFPQYGIVWTGVNNDPGSDEVRQTLYAAAMAFTARAFDMSPKRYLSAMKYAACCIGNSSSFLIEAPALGVPTVNVGDRQKGRLRGPSVFDCPEDVVSIEAMIQFAMDCRCPYDNPYGTPGASKRIAEILTA